MRQMIDSLASLWTEYERRLLLVDSNEYTLKGARHYVWQLNDFMATNGNTDYCPSVGEEFLLSVEDDVKKSKWLNRYKNAISHLNSCLSDKIWFEDFHMFSYSVKNRMLLDLYGKLCDNLGHREFRSNINNSREYALRCIKHMDLFMLEKGITVYSADVGSSFIDCMRKASNKGKACFEQTYTRTISRLNGLLSDTPMYNRIATDYTIKHDELKIGLDKLLRVLSDKSYSERSQNNVIRVIKHMDMYMTDMGTDAYSEQVGMDFSDWFNNHQVITDSHDGYQRYILAHFNDVIAGRDYHCCHRESGVPVSVAFKASFDLFLSDCKEDGNKESTLKQKTYCCAYFFETLLGLGCSDPQDITVENVGKSCSLINASAWNPIRGYLRSCLKHGLVDKDYAMHSLFRIKKGGLFFPHTIQRKKGSAWRRHQIGQHLQGNVIMR